MCHHNVLVWLSDSSRCGGMRCNTQNLMSHWPHMTPWPCHVWQRAKQIFMRPSLLWCGVWCECARASGRLTTQTRLSLSRRLDTHSRTHLHRFSLPPPVCAPPPPPSARRAILSARGAAEYKPPPPTERSPLALNAKLDVIHTQSSSADRSIQPPTTQQKWQMTRQCVMLSTPATWTARAASAPRRWEPSSRHSEKMSR